MGAMVVPQGMSYARLAGLPDVYGLYGAFVPVLIYAALGSSPQLVSLPCLGLGYTSSASSSQTHIVLPNHSGASFLTTHQTVPPHGNLMAQQSVSNFHSMAMITSVIVLVAVHAVLMPVSHQHWTLEMHLRCTWQKPVLTSVWCRAALC